MTQISDSIYTGAATTNTVIGDPVSGLGIRAGQTYFQDFVPLTKNPVAYAASQSVAAAANIVLSAGTGVTTAVINGITRYVADVPRCVTVTSGGNDTGITFTVRGFDKYGAAMSSLVTGGNAATVTTLKSFASVYQVFTSGSVASTVTVGTADIFGLDVAVIDKSYLYTVGNQAKQIDTGTALVADTTNPATALTGDVRGTYAPTYASNGTARVLIETTLNASQLAYGTAAQTAIFGVTQA